MRNRWEDKSGEDGFDDEPVTLSASQLRSLKRGARIGLLSMFLALAVTGYTAWNAWNALNGVQRDAAGSAAPAAEQQTPAAPAANPAATPSPGDAQAPAPAAATETPATGASKPAVVAAEATKASPPRRTSVGTAKYGKAAIGTSKHGSTRYAPASARSKPKTEAFDASAGAPTAKEPAVTPMPSPIPIAPEPQKTAPKSATPDSSASH